MNLKLIKLPEKSVTKPEECLRYMLDMASTEEMSSVAIVLVNKSGDVFILHHSHDNLYALLGGIEGIKYDILKMADVCKG